MATAVSPKDIFRFAVPPSLGPVRVDRTERLGNFLERSLGRPVEVSVAPSYEQLAKQVLNGAMDAAWAPPFVCARLEAMGVRVAVRGIRHGSSTYRAALIARAGGGMELDRLLGTRAAWVDRESVAGYLLPVAMLKARGLDPSRVFCGQTFAGSYRGALEALLEGRAEVTSIFAPASGGGTGVETVWAAHENDVEVLAYTEEAPNDGIALSMETPAADSEALEACLLGLHDSREGTVFLKELFNAERFDPAPRMGYRALYRVAAAAL
jgi:phosphonate transport system substrate-binding protein